ncbi:uncharacterized protein LOC141674065 [Apium graveolens]|uniref:uncharacterized protein LOC141674065 n=1 Tax=Apium graveolens TaxID=4045 RepID=UPI003D7AEF8B
MDAKFPHFAEDDRNVRLGLASDGFSPYRTMSTTHSTWPIVLPLIAELKDLWDKSIETYDALAGENFNLCASILWTISDFPGYGMLSGWSTNGYLGYSVCHYETSSLYLKHSKKVCYMNHRKFLEPNHKWRFDKKRFNGEIEMGMSPSILSGLEVEELLTGFQNQFGAAKQKKGRKKKGEKLILLLKKSILFDLPYWSQNLHRHNLDVMHIEKNLRDNILGTLLNMGGKSKDHLNARFDLQEMGIRKDLHPVLKNDGKSYEIRAAIFDMMNKEKETFCAVLENAKLPYGSASNIRRYVYTKERKITGYKSHDEHFILHYLLQFAVKRILKPEVALRMIRLSAFLRSLWAKVIDLDDLNRLQQEIVEIPCSFEMIFIQAFFDIMVRLPIHLCKEIESRLEASIAEGYLAEECIIFCSRFLNNDGAGKIGKYSAKSEICPQNVEYPISSRRNKDRKAITLKDSQWMECHRYVLFNCANKEVESLLEEHRALIEEQAIPKRFKRERVHTDDFYKWLQEKVGKKEVVSPELQVLSMGPNRVAKKISGYVINGFRFYTKFRDARCTIQNSGVFLSALTTSFASSKDESPLVSEFNYYGRIEEILEIDYWGEISVVLFKCCWYQEETYMYGLIRVNFSKLCQKSDPYVLASQVQQVYYLQDPVDKSYHNVIKKLPRDWSEVESPDANESPDLNEYDKGVENLGYLDFYVDNVVDHKIQPLKQMQQHVVM